MNFVVGGVIHIMHILGEFSRNSIIKHFQEVQLFPLNCVFADL